ncbi:MAG: NAD-dependent succinate-semialdehyde dehydrogenase [Thermoanaerobaculia bacterium]
MKKMFIEGKWCDAASGRRIAVENPATQEPVDEVAYGSAADCRRALEAAGKSLKPWQKRTAYERGAVLKQVAELMRARADSIARTMTLEQGKPLKESKGEVLGSAAYFEWFAEEGKRVYGEIIPPSVPTKRHLVVKHPVGVCAAISPWNFPVSLPVRKIAAALAAGCTVVARPASQTPLCLAAVFECIEEAGAPPGVANLVTGPAEELADEFLGNRICRKISFTGSTEVGKELMRKAAGQLKKLSLELGGHAPFIICPDVPPEAAARVAVASKFRNNGQVCIAASRFFAHEKVRREFAEAAVAQTRALRLGNGLEDVDVGPMFEARALEKATALVEDARAKGARVLCGGGPSKRYERGYFFEPTVLDQVRPEMKLMTEEPFSPILPLADYRDLDEVIDKANDTSYGLAAYVVTRDLPTAVRLWEGLEFGIIGINDFTPATPQCPFGGMKESGTGREGAREGLEAYLETKYVSISLDI